MVESCKVAWNMGLGYCLTMGSWAELLRSSLWDYFVWLFCSLVYFETLRGREIFVVFFEYSQLRLFPFWPVVIVGEMAKPDVHTIHIYSPDWMHWFPFALLFLSTSRVSLLKAHDQRREFFWVGVLPLCTAYKLEWSISKRLGSWKDVCAQTGKSLGNLEVTVLASSSWQELTVLRSHGNRS